VTERGVMEKVNLAEKLAGITEHWRPGIVGEVNDTQVKLAKVRGEFDWHRHEDEDEMFLVLEGRLKMRFRDRDVWLGPGEMLVVPRGVEHKPVAPEEVHLMLVEPRGTLNTGTEQTDRTVQPEWL